MKKGIEATSRYDNAGQWYLELRKKKGRFTLDEIVEAATEHEWDVYALIIKAIPDEGLGFYDWSEDLSGDCVRLYRATDKFAELI